MTLKRHKKIITCCISAVMLLHSTFASAAANTIKINGEIATIPDGMGEISERDGRTFVPVRFVSECLQNNVWFDDITKSACVEGPSSFIYIQNGNNVLYVVSTETNEVNFVTMDTAAYISETDNRTYLPIRFLAETLGYTVGWDEETQTVTLDKN